jgi:hypothetical protein
MNRIVLERLVEIRAHEARLLLEARAAQGAYYLTGYVVECALKVCIAKHVAAGDFPNPKLAQISNSHRLTDLLIPAGLVRELESRERRLPQFAKNWEQLKAWSSTARYEPSIDMERAQQLFHAAMNEPFGVLPWLKSHW